MKDQHTQNFLEGIRTKLYNNGLLLSAGVDPKVASEIVFGKKISDDVEKILLKVNPDKK